MRRTCTVLPLIARRPTIFNYFAYHLLEMADKCFTNSWGKGSPKFLNSCFQLLNVLWLYVGSEDFPEGRHGEQDTARLHRPLREVCKLCSPLLCVNQKLQLPTLSPSQSNRYLFLCSDVLLIAQVT